MIAKLFGRFRKQGEGGDAAPSRKGAGKPEEYQGYTIYPVAKRDGSQWLTAGVIVKQTEEGEREHAFIRADKYSTRDDADACAIRKAHQIIDEQGDKLFS